MILGREWSPVIGCFHFTGPWKLLLKEKHRNKINYGNILNHMTTCPEKKKSYRHYLHVTYFYRVPPIPKEKDRSIPPPLSPQTWECYD